MPRGRSYKRRYGRRRYKKRGRGKMTLYKTVREVKKLKAGQETKRFVKRFDLTSLGTTPQQVDINEILEGVSDDEMIGSKIWFNSFRLKFFSHLDSNTRNVMRVVAILWTGTTGGTPSFSTVFYGNDSQSNALNAALAPKRAEQSATIKILLDKMFPLTADGSPQEIYFDRLFRINKLATRDPVSDINFKNQVRLFFVMAHGSPSAPRS